MVVLVNNGYSLSIHPIEFVLFDCREFATNQKSKQQLTQIPEAMKNEVLVQRVSVNDKCFISLSIN